MGERGLVSPKTHYERGQSPPPLSWWVIVDPNAKPGTDLPKESLFGGMIVPFGVVSGTEAVGSAGSLETAEL
jgi:hypothetical protein